MTDKEVKELLIETSRLRSECDISQILAVLSEMVSTNSREVNNFLSLNYTMYNYMMYQMIKHREFVNSDEGVAEC